jgi:hypothetical protein
VLQALKPCYLSFEKLASSASLVFLVKQFLCISLFFKFLFFSLFSLKL